MKRIGFFQWMTQPKSTLPGGKAVTPLKKVCGGEPGEILLPEPTLVEEDLGRYQELVAGEGGKGLVGRVAVTGRAQRQNLPKALAGFPERVGEGEGLGP